MSSIGLAWSAGRAERRPVRREAVLLKAVRWAGRTLPKWKKVRSTTLQVSAFGFIDWALFEWALIPGLIGVGLSLLVLEFLGSEK